MNYIEIPNRGEFPIPADWDELDQLQVSKILQLLVKLNAGLVDFDDFIVRAFYIIARIKRNWLSVCRERLRNTRNNQEKLENTYILAEYFTKFLFKTNEKNERTTAFFYNTVKNFFPTIKVNKTVFVGPQDFLTDLSFGELRRAVDAMNDLQTAKTEENLNNFFVLLYRPQRTPLPQANLAALAKTAAKIPYHIKLASLLWFTTCVAYITTADITINGRTVNFAPLFPKPKAEEKTGEKKKDSGLGWLSLLFGIAKEGVFGDADKTDARNFYDILLYMLDNHQQQIRLKIASKK